MSAVELTPEQQIKVAVFGLDRPESSRRDDLGDLQDVTP